MAKQKLIVTDPSFKLYSKELNKLSTMNTKRENEIKQQMLDPTVSKETKTKLKHELVKGYLKFVIQQAGKLKFSGIEVVDLISEGNMGLMIAVEKFDWNSKNKFGTFAQHWVRAQMMICIYEHARIIRLPQNIAQELHRQTKAFMEENKEMSGEYVNLPYAIDLYKRVGDDEDSTLVDLIKNENAVDIEHSVSLKDQVDLLMSKLDERESNVISLLFGLNGIQKDMKEIADDYNLNVETIRNIQNKALKKMSLV